ncbi:MAG: MlaD family protein [Candidatus Palauibacterales bacterium]|nr:MlaD family protein [Candidatus Palauibacterales bacterium]
MRDAGVRDRHRAEFQVGALVIVSLLVLFGGVLWISGASIGGDEFRIFARSEDAAQVKTGDVVLFRGVRMGSVSGVRIAEGAVVLTLSLNAEQAGELPADSRAMLQPGGFLGTQQVRILAGESSASLRSGDTISARPAPEITQVASQLSSEASGVLSRTRQLLSERTVASVERSTEDFAATMDRLRQLVREEQGSLQRMISHLDSVTARLEAASDGPRVERTVASLDTLTARLKETSSELEESSTSLSSILGKMDRGEGTLGKLVNDDRLYERARNAMVNLQRASEELAGLTADIRRRPGRYLKVSLF